MPTDYDRDRACHWPRQAVPGRWQRQEARGASDWAVRGAASRGRRARGTCGIAG